jgi:hypothetical protein
MNFKRIHIFNSLVFLGLLSINIIIFINRDIGYAYTQSLSYNQLYQIQECLGISKINYNQKDSLEIEFSSPNYNTSKWDITLPDSSTYTIIGKAKLKLLEGSFAYHLKNNIDTKKTITLKLNYVSQKTYEEGGRKRNSDVELQFCSVPLKNKKTFSEKHWVQSFQYTTEDEVKVSKKILRDSIRIVLSDNSLTKIKKIGSYILKKIGSKRGLPMDTMDFLSPLQRFEFAQKNKSKVWCGDFSDIFSFFANLEGIPTRSVWVEGDANGIKSAGHSFNETYVEELGKWIFIDLTSNTLGIQNANEEYLNTLQFYNGHQLKTSDLFLTIYHDSVYKTPIDYTNSFYNNYFGSNNNFVFYNSRQFNTQLYSFSEKIKRYFLKCPTFGIYSNQLQADNTKFYFKQMAAIFLVLYILYLAIFYFIYKISIHKKQNTI